MTETVKHVPGPWKVVEDPFISVVTEWTVMDDDEPSSDTYHTIVHDCDYDGWGDLSVPRANARLIAAAPDLLATLKALRNECSGKPRAHMLPALLRQADAVIAKAEGRT